MSRIISLETAVPAYQSPQSSILEFMQEAYHDELASRKLSSLFRSSGINSRYSVVPDFDKSRQDAVMFDELHELPQVETRMSEYKNNALPLAIEAIEKSLQQVRHHLPNFQVTHLITISCTGLYAPGLDAEIISYLKLPRDLFHTSVNFLGCNAAFHGLKIADMIARTNEDAKVLLVCVELCTLHFQPKNNHDNLLSNTVFGDGAASAIITPGTYSDKHKLKGLDIKGFFSLLLDEAKGLMGWNITPVNFEMILNAKVPLFIGEKIEEIVSKAEKKLNFDAKQVNTWAIHPGGKKILDTLTQQAILQHADLTYSYKILQQFGNMSSSTILFVLKEIFENMNKHEDPVFAIGFGPGLSIETSLLHYAC